MKKFNFNLQKLLDYKKILLDEEISRINVINQEIRKCDEKIANIEQRIINLSQGITGKKQILTGGLLVAYNRYISDLKNLRVSLTKQKAFLEMELDKAKDKAISLQKEYKTVNTLKEKRYAEYKREILYQEQGILDELVMNKYTRGELNGSNF